MIDPKDYSLSLGNPQATHHFICEVNKEFKELREMIAALEEKLTASSTPVAKKVTKNS